MKLLGIDPGTEESAVVIWDGAKVLRAEMMPSSTLTGIVGLHRLPVACEHIQCFGLPVGKETFEVAYWIGELRFFCRERGIEFHRVYRSEEKMALCHSMQAKDSNIRQALIDRFGPVGRKKEPGPLFGIANDLWSALAVAVVCHDRLPPEQPCFQS